MEPITKIINAVCNLAPGKNPFECAIGLIVVVVVLRLEVGRNAGNMPHQNVGQTSVARVARCKKLLQQYAPETIGLLAFILLAAALRIRGSYAVESLLSEDGQVDNPSAAAMAEIARQWPMLVTADTLLSLQAMLRLLVLASSVLRMGGGPSLLTQEAAAISCGAALGRAALVAYSNVYMLDGPLGGYLPAAIELFSFALLVILCRGIRPCALMTSVLTLGVAACIAYRNHLSLANDILADALFIFAHVAELLAAFAYLSHAVLLDFEVERVTRGSVALGFAHVIMPVQACLAAYYFVQAFEVVPSMVGAGHPFQVLQWGCVAQVGAYAGAALLHWAEYLESAAQEPATNPGTSTESGAIMPRHAAVPAVL